VRSSKYFEEMQTVIYGAPYVQLHGFYLHILSKEREEEQVSFLFLKDCARA